MRAALRVVFSACLVLGSVTCKSNKRDSSRANEHSIKELITTLLDKSGQVVGVLKTTAHYPEDSVPNDTYTLLNKIPFAIKTYLDNELNTNSHPDVDDTEDFNSGLAVPKHLLSNRQRADSLNTLFSRRSSDYHQREADHRHDEKPDGFSRANGHSFHDYDDTLHASFTPFSRSKFVSDYAPSAQSPSSFEEGFAVYPLTVAQRTGNPYDRNLSPILQQPRANVVISNDFKDYASPEDAANYVSAQNARGPYVASQNGYNPYPNIQNWNNPYTHCQAQCASYYASFNPGAVYWALLKCYQDCCNPYYGSNGYSKDGAVYKNAFYDDGRFAKKSDVGEGHNGYLMNSKKTIDKTTDHNKNIECNELNNCNTDDEGYLESHDKNEDLRESSNSDHNNEFSDEKSSFSRKIGDNDHIDSTDKNKNLSVKNNTNDYNTRDSKEHKEDIEDEGKNAINIGDYEEHTYDDVEDRRNNVNDSFPKSKDKKGRLLNDEDYSEDYGNYNDKENDTYKGDVAIDNIVLL